MKFLSMLLALVFAGMLLETNPAAANASRQQEEKKTATKETKWQGTVLQVLKDQSMINIRGGAGGGAGHTVQIAYDSSTEWTKLNKPGGKQDDVKEGSRIIAVGHVDDKGVLHATRIDLRLPK